jgi:hypothetical protein
MRRLFTLGAVAVLGVVALFVARETREVVALAMAVDARLGYGVLVVLLGLYAVVLGVPVAMLLRLPRPLRPPASDEGPEFQAHLAALARRLSRNPHCRDLAIAATDRAAIEGALARLHERARAEMQAAATVVFLSTAVSQSGRLDGLMVLLAQSRMVWRIAHLYAQRPALSDLVRLYANVAATALLAEQVEDVELEEIVEPVLAPVVAGSALGAIPGAAGVATFVMESILEGGFNAFLTLRVGCVASRHCAALTRPDRRGLRRSATAEAAAILPGVVLAGAGRVSGAIWTSARRTAVGDRAAALATAVRRSAEGVVTAMGEVAARSGVPRAAASLGRRARVFGRFRP